MKTRGPLVTLGAVALLSAGLWVANVSRPNDPAPPSVPVAASTPSAVPPSPAPDPFPAKADHVARIVTKTGTIVLEITVDGPKAVAYACDGNTVEEWLSGSAEGGVLKLASKDKSSTLDGRHVGKAIVGTLRIGGKSWEFTTSAVEAPAPVSGVGGVA